MSNKLRKIFESFEEAPQKEVWDNIKSQIPKPKFNFLALFTISGAAILVLGIIILFVASPTTKNEEDILVSKNIENKVEENNNVEKTITNNDTKTIANDRVEQKQANPINNDVSDKNSLDKSNNTLQSNHISTEKNIQIIDNENLSQKVANPFIASTVKPLTQVKDRVEKVNNIEEKVSPIIEQDTNATRRFLFIPNAFTPTATTNNVFKPAYTVLKSYEMKIFNRSGILLFTSKDINKGWDGYYKGRLCDVGTYVYIIKCENMDGTTHPEDGIVNLIR
ncbi:MAG: gliding motility-associated C-terminal domain-containing protein [Bacteroidales bacterium]